MCVCAHARDLGTWQVILHCDKDKGILRDDVSVPCPELLPLSATEVREEHQRQHQRESERARMRERESVSERERES
jgi:hypothetical protein